MANTSEAVSASTAARGRCSFVVCSSPFHPRCRSRHRREGASTSAISGNPRTPGPDTLDRGSLRGSGGSAVSASTQLLRTAAAPATGVTTSSIGTPTSDYHERCACQLADRRWPPDLTSRSAAPGHPSASRARTSMLNRNTMEVADSTAPHHRPVTSDARQVLAPSTCALHARSMCDHPAHQPDTKRRLEHPAMTQPPWSSRSRPSGHQGLSSAA